MPLKIDRYANLISEMHDYSILVYCRNVLEVSKPTCFVFLTGFIFTSVYLIIVPTLAVMLIGRSSACDTG